MALSRDIVIRLLGDADSAVKAQKAAADAAEVSVGAYRRAEREFDKQQKAMDASSRKQRAAMQDVGQVAAGFGAAMAAGLGMAVNSAVKWESAWAGVTKTMADDADLVAIEKGLRDLTKVLPATHTEIAAVAEAAGQLGVESGSIVDFTRTMVDLAQTTNLTSDEAATSLAQLMNVMGTAPDDVGRLGASLVELGNNGASTEKDILSMAQRLSGAGALIGASESDVLALASSMSDLGIEAQLGGGVMTRVLQKIYSATLEGGDAVAGFAEVAGMSAKDFAAAFESDPMRAVAAFTSGLNDVEASGGNVVTTLADLGLRGTEEASVLLRMKGASDGLSTSLDTSSAAWAENTALVDEAAKRYDTTESKMAIARNALTEAGIEIGEVLLPVLATVAESVADVATWFAELPGPVKDVLAVLGGIAGAAGLAGGAFLILAPRVAETFRAFRDLNTASPGVASGLGKVGKAAGIAGVVFAAASALDGLVNSMRPAPATMEETTAALLALGESTDGMDEQFAALGSTFTDIDNLNDAMRRLVDPSVREDMGDWTAKVISFGSREGNDTRERLVDQFNRIGESLGLMVTSGNADLAAQQFEMLREQWEANGGSVAELNELLPGYTEALKGVENEQEIAAQSAEGLAAGTGAAGAAVGQTAVDLDAAYGSLEGYAAALGMDEDATADLIKKTQELGQSLADFADPLAAYTGLLQEKTDADRAAAEESATVHNESIDEQIEGLRRRTQAELDALDSTAVNAGEQRAIIEGRRDTEIGALEQQKKSWEDYVGSVDVSLDEYLARLQKQVEDQREWQTNMLLIAGRVSQGTLDELARMGPEGAPLVADLVNASDAEIDKMDELFAARSKEATDAWGAQLTLAAPVLAAIGRTAGSGVVAELAAQLQAGTITVAEIARQYGVNLAGGINPVLTSLGKPKVTIQAPGGPNRNTTGFFAADGTLVDYYADGGTRENHVAQIAPAGAWRVWAEDETGGEAYIPLAASKRGRSLDIWRETGKRLGVPDVQQFYSGALVTFGKRLQGMGARVAEHPAFPPLSMSGHGKTSLHYTGDAIDVNTRAGTSALEQRELGAMAAAARAAGFRTIFMSPGHYNHLHVDSGKGGSIGSAGGPPAVVLPQPPSTRPFQAPISTVADAAMRKIYDEATAWVATNTATEIEGEGLSPGGKGGFRDLGRQIAASMGVGGQFGAIDSIFTRESNWNPNAQNPTSTAYGIPQFLAATWRQYGGKTSDPARQIRAGIQYMDDRYGSPNQANAFWNRNHWYANGALIDPQKGDIFNPHVRDQGGPLLPGYTYNGTGRNEWVVPTPPGLPVGSAQAAVGGFDYGKFATALAAALPTRIGNVTFPPSDGRTATETIGELVHAISVYDRGGKYAGAAR